MGTLLCYRRFEERWGEVYSKTSGPTGSSLGVARRLSLLTDEKRSLPKRFPVTRDWRVVYKR